MSVMYGFFQVARSHDHLWAQLLPAMFEKNENDSLGLSSMQNGAPAKTRTADT